jgi:asparagine synthase (glutamine-hydrolysing)
MGFFIGAMGTWFRAQAGGAIEEYLLGDNPRYAALLEPREVARLVRDQAASRSQHDRLLVSILMLEVWLRDYLPRATGDTVAAAAPVRVPA